MEIYKILAKATVTKLKEYSRSRGAAETVNYSFIKDYPNEIWLCSSEGNHIRTLRKGTKLLLNYSGTEISKRAYNTRINKATKLREIKSLKTHSKHLVVVLKNAELSARQMDAWNNFLKQNPEKITKYIQKCNSMPSSKWRNLIRMKFAKHCNNGVFSEVYISAPELYTALHSHLK